MATFRDLKTPGTFNEPNFHITNCYCIEKIANIEYFGF